MTAAGPDAPPPAASAPRQQARPVSTWLGRFGRGVVGPPLAALWRTRVIGREHIPDGAAILCGNHVSNLDPLLVCIAAPRLVHFMAKIEAWGNPIGRWVMPRLGAFPVKRGEADRAAIANGVRLLGEGKLLGVFPEGTRDEEHRGQGEGGAAFLALKTGAPVVPLGVAGTEGIWPKGARVPRFPRVTIRFGEPIEPDRFTSGGRRERIDEMTAAIMAGIARELEEAGAA